jgi:hypothetical protein
LKPRSINPERWIWLGATARRRDAHSRRLSSKAKHFTGKAKYFKGQVKQFMNPNEQTLSLEVHRQLYHLRPRYLTHPEVRPRTTAGGENDGVTMRAGGRGRNHKAILAHNKIRKGRLAQCGTHYMQGHINGSTRTAGGKGRSDHMMSRHGTHQMVVLGDHMKPIRLAAIRLGDHMTQIRQGIHSKVMPGDHMEIRHGDQARPARGRKKRFREPHRFILNHATASAMIGHIFKRAIS